MPASQTNPTMTIQELKAFGKSLNREYMGVIPKSLCVTWNPYRFDKEDAANNVKNVYYECLNTLRNYDIGIHRVDKHLPSYFNATIVMNITEKPVFDFLCHKGNYVFHAKFVDDADCKPGIFSIHDVIHTPTNTKIDVQCDMFSNNTSKSNKKEFLMLLDSINFDDYFEKRYRSLMNLPAELTKRILS